MLSVFAPPRVIVEVAGAQLGNLEAASLTEVVVRQVLSAPGQCELTFVDPSPDADVAGTCAPGSALRLRMPGQDQALFDGEVTAVERSYQPDRGRAIRVRAYDKLHRLRKNGGPRVHLDVTAARLAGDLAGAAGLSVDARADGPSQARVVQTRQSDLELLLDVCERAGLFLDADGDVLRLITLEGTGTTVPLVLGGTLIEADVETNGDAALRRVGARGWDVDRLETHQATATNARTGRTVQAEVAPDAVGGSGERSLLDERASDDEAALGLAQATLDLGAAAEVVLRGVAVGDPRLRPGCTVEISGVDTAIAGRYVLTEVRHTIDRGRGYLSELSSAPPTPAPRQYATVVTVGEVRSADDPDRRGRVLVVLPSLGDLETAWLEVVSVGAGSNKGLVALPDAGDRVLVLLTHGDPASGVVLGGLYGSDGPFDSGVEGGAVKRFTLRTSGGHIVRLDDEEKTLRIEDTTGSHIEMAQDKVTVHAAVDLRIEAPGKNIKVVAASIDFETG
jgi:uncharacterized protein involved in type VI secretion and phage assembly